MKDCAAHVALTVFSFFDMVSIIFQAIQNQQCASEVLAVIYCPNFLMRLITITLKTVKTDILGIINVNTMVHDYGKHSVHAVN